MATFLLGGYAATQTKFPAASNRIPTLKEVTVDFAATSGYTALTTGSNSIASGSSISVMELPAGCVVLAAGVEVLVANDASATLALGDASSTARYGAATASTSTGQMYTTTSAVPYVYAANGILQLLTGGATITVGKVRVWVVIVEAVSHPAAATATL